MTPLVRRLSALWAELRRRRVVRALGLYLVGAWVVIEVSATILPLLFFPEWAPTAVVVLAVLGVPLVLVFSWAFDLTTEGVQRTGAPADAPVLPLAGRIALVGLAVLATGVAGWGARGLWLIPSEAQGGEPALDPARVAVLYFDDFSEGRRLGFLADGLTEALIHELAQMQPLEVVSRNGVKPFRDLTIPVDSLARVLQAGTLVEGSVEGTPERLHATIQLIDGRTGAHLLSQRLAFAGDDILALRDSLVLEAAGILGRALGRELEVERRKRGTDDPVAWERVERARRMIAEADTVRWSLGDARAAHTLLRQADSLLTAAAADDPAWAEPLLLRARVASDMAGDETAARQDRDGGALRRGIQLAEAALDRAPGSAGALAWRGVLRSRLSWVESDSADALTRGAESDFRSAVALDEGNAPAWVGLADLLRARGDFAEAAIAAERALAADPFLIHAEQSILFTLGHIWLELEEFDRALRWAREGQRRYPAVPAFAAQRLAILAGWTGAPPVPDSAWALVRAVEEAYDMDRWAHGHLQAAAVLARAAQPDSARSVLANVLEGASDDPWRDYYEANVRLQLGERERTLELLERFIDFMPHRRSYIARDWWWRPLRESPRFQALTAPSAPA